jgi:hypothetical protein
LIFFCFERRRCAIIIIASKYLVRKRKRKRERERERDQKTVSLASVCVIYIIILSLSYIIIITVRFGASSDVSRRSGFLFLHTDGSADFNFLSCTLHAKTFHSTIISIINININNSRNRSIESTDSKRTDRVLRSSYDQCTTRNHYQTSNIVVNQK